MRLYTICKLMKWTHLPSAGGLYDQHPKFLDDILVVARVENKVQAAEQKKRETETKRKQARSSGRRAGRR